MDYFNIQVLIQWRTTEARKESMVLAFQNKPRFGGFIVTNVYMYILNNFLIGSPFSLYQLSSYSIAGNRNAHITKMSQHFAILIKLKFLPWVWHKIVPIFIESYSGCMPTCHFWDPYRYTFKKLWVGLSHKVVIIFKYHCCSSIIYLSWTD